MLVGTVTCQHGTLHGSIVKRAALRGVLVNNTVLLAARAQIPASINTEVYDGEYDVIPRIDAHVLDTKNKLMQDDVTVLAIPYYEVSNEQDGYTAIIAEI